MEPQQFDPDELRARFDQRVAEDPKYGTIATRLRELFWDSECNDITLRFYERLQEEAIWHGEPVRRVIKAVAASALKADYPVRYFAASVARRLREHGYLRAGDDDTGL